MNEIISIPGFSEPMSSFTHLFIIPFFIVLFILLLIRGAKNGGVVSYLVFSISACFMFSMSGVYHLLEPGGIPRMVLKRLDHAGIFLLIAATSTPIHSVLFSGFKKWGYLSLIWIIAFVGITLKLIFFQSIPEWLGLMFYLGMGWMGIITGYLCYQKYGLYFIRNLLYGAFAYTIGAILDFIRIPFLIQGIFGHHEVFHIFVILGVYFHWKFLYDFSERKEKGKNDLVLLEYFVCL